MARDWSGSAFTPSDWSGVQSTPVATRPVPIVTSSVVAPRTSTWSETSPWQGPRPLQ